MEINFVEKAVGSGFYTGYIPLASGTFGSLAGLILYYIPGFETPPVLFSAIIIFTILGIYLGNKFEKVYGKDPAECTIDEIVGMWIALLYLPKTIWISVLAFIVWRILDVIKPFPAKELESLQGGLGIMIDDIIAGIYSLGIVHLILFIFK